MFSPNTPSCVREEICSSIRIPETQNPGKYLGLPTVWGRSKHEALNFVKERVMAKVKGWKHSLLSLSGKEVLIKAVATAVPAFPMSVFKFPKKSCSELNSILSNFWWGEGQNGNKLHWKSWDKLSRSKFNGGLGFRELEDFNIALLAKLCWRILSCPNALWVRMLKGVYFKDKGFMEAKKGCHPSWCWSSILTGRDLLEENIAWKVGNGDDINLWHDKWVVGIKGLKLSCERIPDELFQQKVSSIIDDQPKRWNLGSIEQHVNLVEKEAILAITLPEAEKEECVVWPANKSGVYMVKSGYQILHSARAPSSAGASSSHDIDSRLWKVAWNISTVPKVKSFLWKAISNIIPVMRNLKQKRSVVDSLCLICHNEEETVEHCLLLCEWTKGIWYGVLNYKVDKLKISTFDRWLLGMADGFNAKGDERRGVLTFVAYICWYIWKCRCKFVYEAGILDIGWVIGSVISSVREWESNLVMPIKPPTAISRWVLPEGDALKANCDGSFKDQEFLAGVGVVFRNASGSLVDGVGSICPASSSFGAEVLAVKAGMEKAREKGYAKVTFEIDSKDLYDAIQDATRAPWSVSSTVEDVQALLRSFPSWSLSLVRREANAAANWVAKWSKIKEVAH